MSRTSLLAALLLLCAAAGCSRSFYRTRADQDAYDLLGESAARSVEPCDVPQPFGNLSIQPDPRSRMFDPYDPDCEPMPPDDPAAHQLMHCVDGKKGYPHWDAAGFTPFVENPDWQCYIARDEHGQVVIDADESVRLGLLHSRDYQFQLETLYVSALDVSFERFQFDAQFFGGYSVDYFADGPDRNGTGDSSSTLTLSTFPGARGIRMNKLYTTGAELVVGLANSLIWEFSGQNDYFGTTLIDFALVQPLLRAAGRDVVMEALTQSQRTLLANVRQFERFRRGFYVEVVTGRTAGLGPTQAGSVAGTGVQGGFGAAGGFLGLVADLQNIRNQESNIASLRASLAQLEAFFMADRIDFFQVELTRQTLFERQSRLLTTRTAYESELDDFKLLLGLPPQLDVRVDDEIIDPFNLIDTEIVPVRNRLTALQVEVGEIIVELLPPPEAFLGAGELAQQDAGRIEWNDDLLNRLRALDERLEVVQKLRDRIVEVNLPRARRDLKMLKEAVPGRRKELEKLAELLEEQMQQQQQQRQVDEQTEQEREEDEELLSIESTAAYGAGIIDTRRIDEMPGELQRVLAQIEQVLTRFEQEVKDLRKEVSRLIDEGADLRQDELRVQLRRNLLGDIPTTLNDLSIALLELTLVQARARTETVSLVPISLDSDEAVEIARFHRRDWRNARSELVDAWRNIQVVANDLESDLDIYFEGDIRNVGDNPFELRGTAGRLRVGAEFDAPLTRLAERNAYREALIEYQQARRRYYAFEDFVAEGLCDTLRRIELNQINFELRRAAVHVAISQVELTQLRLQEPPQPGQNQQFGNTTARDLVDALSQLLDVQNDFFAVWIDYEGLRRILDFDLGTMQLDGEGLWIDPGEVGGGQATTAPGTFEPIPGVLEFGPLEDLPQPGAGPPADGPPADGPPARVPPLPRPNIEPLPPGDQPPPGRGPTGP